MAITVGVIDPLPMVRRQLRIGLHERGFETVDSPNDVAGFLRGRGQRALVVSLVGSFGLAELDSAVAADRKAPIVTLLDSASTAVYQELLRRERVYPVPRTVSAALVAQCVFAALRGECTLPDSVARAMARAIEATNHAGLTGEELGWMRALANGVTVSELAGRAGLSERSLYRHLKRAYSKLGADTRTKALLRLSILGLLGTPWTHADPEALAERARAP